MNVYLWANEIDPKTLGSLDLEGIYKGNSEVWKNWGWPLCFTAKANWSTVALKTNGSPTSVTLETSTNLSTWTTYTIWDTITLTNIWDKVYWRNTSTTTTWFSTDPWSNHYYFSLSGALECRWDVTYLINKKWTKTLTTSSCFGGLFNSCTSLYTAPELPATELTTLCYRDMFSWCTWLTIVPVLPATTLAERCYENMFYNCTNLESLPALPATTLIGTCYQYMFGYCSKIKISMTQTWEYQTPYRIPITWTWTEGGIGGATNYMFDGTWWTFTGTPTINTTYYTSNTVIS